MSAQDLMKPTSNSVGKPKKAKKTSNSKKSSKAVKSSVLESNLTEVILASSSSKKKSKKSDDSAEKTFESDLSATAEILPPVEKEVLEQKTTEIEDKIAEFDAAETQITKKLAELDVADKEKKLRLGIQAQYEIKEAIEDYAESYREYEELKLRDQEDKKLKIRDSKEDLKVDNNSLTLLKTITTFNADGIVRAKPRVHVSELNAFLNVNKCRYDQVNYKKEVAIKSEDLAPFYATIDPNCIYEGLFKDIITYDEIEINSLLYSKSTLPIKYSDLHKLCTFKNLPEWISIKSTDNYRIRASEEPHLSKVTVLSINLQTLAKENETIFSYFLTDPVNILLYLRLKIFEYTKLRTKIYLDISKLSSRAVPALNFGSGSNLNSLTCYSGLLKSLDEKVDTAPLSQAYRCLSCGNYIYDIKLYYEQSEDILKCACGEKRNLKKSSANNIVLQPQGNIYETWRSGTLLREDSGDSNGLIPFRIMNPSLIAQKYKPGDRVEVVGVLTYRPGDRTNIIEPILEVHGLKRLNEANTNAKITKEVVAEMKKFSKEPNFWSVLTNNVFGNFVGSEDLKKAIILQQFSSPEIQAYYETRDRLLDNITDNERHSLQDRLINRKRQNIHILIVGDAGTGKTKLLDSALASFKGVKVVATNATPTGLTATTTKINSIQGVSRWSVEAGAFPSAHGQTLYLDELDKVVTDQVYSALLEGMQNQTISYAKANVTGFLPAETKLLAVSNPKNRSRFDPRYPKLNQIGLPRTLLTRFDLIYPLIEVDNKSKLMALSQKFMVQDRLDFTLKNFILDYIKISKKIRKISIGKEVAKKMTELIQELSNRIMNVKKVNQEFKNVNARVLDSLERLIKAKARSRLSRYVNLQDFMFVRDLIWNNYESLYGVEIPSYDTEGNKLEDSINIDVLQALRKDTKLDELKLDAIKNKKSAASINKELLIAVARANLSNELNTMSELTLLGCARAIAKLKEMEIPKITDLKVSVQQLLDEGLAYRKDGFSLSFITKILR